MGILQEQPAFFTFSDCTAELSGRVLTVQNSKIKRTWNLTDGGIVPGPIVNMVSGETVTEDNRANISPVIVPEGEKFLRLALEGRTEDDYGFAKKHLHCFLTMDYSCFCVQYEIIIYPSLPVIRTRLYVKGSGKLPLKDSVILDTARLREKHCEWQTVTMRAVTDWHNNLVQTESGLLYLRGVSRLCGNILRIHRTLQKDGLIFIKEAPAMEEQVRYLGHDFILCAKKAVVHSSGFAESDIMPDEFVPLYGTAVCLYAGGDTAFYKALRDYHEARHVFNPEYDAAISSNTWGDDNGGKKICEEFIQNELDVAHDTGITHYQIDAGWDTGEKDEEGACKWNVKYSALPAGFEHIREKVKRYDMTLGLWFEPFTGDGCRYEHYKKDAQTLVDLYYNHGAEYFKLDGFKLLSYTATYRFEKMLRLVLAGTGSRVFFNIDITNYPRTGFLCATQYANLFLENRYTDRINYYPHYTLRNIWQISRYFPSYRLQAEFLNTGRNAALYETDEKEDALAPGRCGQEYAAASVLFASPLAWLETTGLDKKHQDAVKRLLKATQAIRCELGASCILPIGEIPNGAHYTGLQAIGSETGGYLLLLRETGAQSGPSDFIYKLYSQNMENAVFTPVIANCVCKICAVSDSEIAVSLEHGSGFALYRYEIK